MDDFALKALIKRVEGWATGLRLISLSLRHRGSLDLSPARLGGDVAYVSDYLMAEILASQPPAIQEFLLKTSILDRLNGSLCDALIGLDEPECNGQAYLEWLHQTGLFTVPLDDNRQWYRYHRLFRDLLRGQLKVKLGGEGIAALHSRASAWFAQNHLMDEALHHALVAGEPEAAANMVARHRHTLIDGEQWQRLERWLLLFDQATIEARAGLSIIQAWVHNVHGRWQQELATLARVEMLLAGTEMAPEVADPIR